MPLEIVCNKGCGYPVTVSDEALEEAKKLGQPFSAAHGTCPNSPEAPKNYYKVRVIVERQKSGEEHWDTLGQVSAKTEAPTLREAMSSLTNQLNMQWNSVMEMSTIAEQEDDMPVLELGDDGL